MSALLLEPADVGGLGDDLPLIGTLDEVIGTIDWTPARGHGMVVGHA